MHKTSDSWFNDQSGRSIVVTVLMVWRQHTYLDRIRSELEE